jgi:hypothetical protein
MHLSYLNYIAFSGHGSDWAVHLKRSTSNSLGSWKAECIRAAQIISKEASGPIILLFSGGLDSEFMIRVFTEAAVEFKVGIIDYNGWNTHDTKYAYEYCNHHNINPITVSVDIEKLISSGEFEDIAVNVKCCAHQMIPVMKGLTLFDGTVIMANGEPYFKNYEGNWVWQETEKVNAYNNFYSNYNINGTPDFLRYTPEMVLAFTNDSLVKDLVANKLPGKLSTRTSKIKIYSDSFNFIPREKYTGWEKIQETSWHEKALNITSSLQENYNGVFELSIDELINCLTRL